MCENIDKILELNKNYIKRELLLYEKIMYFLSEIVIKIWDL